MHPASVDDLLERYDAECEQAADPYWAVPWPSAFAMAEYLHEHGSAVANKRVCDAGCGLGLAGIAALACGASFVALADREPLAVRCAELGASASGFAVASDARADATCTAVFGSEGDPPPRAPPDAPQVAMGAVFDWDEAEDYDAMLERAGGRS